MKNHTPRETPEPLVIQQELMQGSLDKEGFPVGKQGVCTQTWVRPGWSTVWFLMGVQEKPKPQLVG